MPAMGAELIHDLSRTERRGKCAAATTIAKREVKVWWCSGKREEGSHSAGMGERHWGREGIFIHPLPRKEGIMMAGLGCRVMEGREGRE